MEIQKQNKISKKSKKVLKLSKEAREFLNNLPHNKMEIERKEKIARRKDKFWNTLSAVSLVYLASGGLRALNVIEKPNIYTNNEKVIMQNLDEIGLTDDIFIRSPLNKEILISMQKNLTVSIDNSLDAEQRKCLISAVNYVNYVIHGINPEYSIKMEVQNPFTDIKVHAFNKSTDVYSWLTNIKNPDYDKDRACMISSFTQGFINHNGIYKSQIHVDKEYFDMLYNEDKEDFYNFCTTTYIHELCHCIFGINDFSSSRFYSIMEEGNSRTSNCMLYHDLMCAVASISNLENKEEKIRAYEFVINELQRQIENEVDSESYRKFLEHKIQELSADISVLKTDMEMN